MASELIFRFLQTVHDHKQRVQATWIEHRGRGFKAVAYKCSLNEDFDGAPRCYGWPNPDPIFGQTVNAAANPATQLQRDIVERRERQRPDLANPRATLDYLRYAASHPGNLGRPGAHFAWVGLIARQPSETTKVPILVPNADPRKPPTLVQVNSPSLDMRPGLGARIKVIQDRDGNEQHVALGANEESVFPVIQDGSMPSPGFFVSSSALARDRGLPETDPRRFVDAQNVPYQAGNGWMGDAGAWKGDFGLVLDPVTGAISGYIIADWGGDHDTAGEVSTKLLIRLGGNNEKDYLFLLFPGSGAGIDPVMSCSESGPDFAASVELAKLSNDPAAARDLIMFLGFGADLDRFNTWRNQDHVATPDEDALYTNIYQILVDWGLSRAGVSLRVD